MKKKLLLISAIGLSLTMSAQYDWDDTKIGPDAGDGKVWQLQENMSDDFSIDFEPSTQTQYIHDKWWNFWHNSWDGPGPTQYKTENVYATGGHLNIAAKRNGDTKKFTHYYNGGVATEETMTATQMGCMVSKEHVVYPVFVEAKVKIADACFANNIWMISDDDYEEIDICENYGAADKGGSDNSWFAKSIHLSHHMFNNRHLANYDDYQPRDEEGVYGTWYYENGKTDWAGEYTTIGVYWKDPNHLEYYINGKWVRTLAGKEYAYKNSSGTLIEKTKDFNVLDKFEYAGGKGITKPMKLIINIEVQDWNAVDGRMPTDEEIANDPDGHIMKVDWIRVYKPVNGTANPEPITDTTITATGQSVKIESENLTDHGGDYEDGSTDDSGLNTPNAGININATDINYVNEGDWAEYTNVNIPANGDYQIKFHTAGPYSGVKVYIDNILSNTLTDVGTGNYSTYKEIMPSEVLENITAGNHTVKFEFTGATWAPNFDWFEFVEIQSGDTTVTTTNPVVSDGGGYGNPWDPDSYTETSIDNEDNSNLNIYPNPTSGMLYIDTNLDIVENIEIYNSIGAKVYEAEFTGSIDLSSLNKGIYLIKVGEDIQRIIIE